MIGTFSMKESNVTFKVNKQHHWRCTSIFIVRVEHISHFFLVFSCRIWTGKAVNYFRKNLYPYKYFTWIPRWNDVKTVVSTSFQRGIHVVCLLGSSMFDRVPITPLHPVRCYTPLHPVRCYTPLRQVRCYASLYHWLNNLSNIFVDNFLIRFNCYIVTR